MSDANLLSALDNQADGSYKRPALSGILVYGRVRSLIKRPKGLGQTIKDTDGYYALLDAYALKCLYDDYFGEKDDHDVNKIYFTRGSMLLYIDSPKWVGKDVKVSGKTSRSGVTIRKQDFGKAETGISAFVFDRPIKDGGKNVFPIIPNKLSEIGARDPEFRGTVLEDMMAQIFNSSTKAIPYPKTLDTLIPYTGIEDYEELVVDDESVKSTFRDDSGRLDISKIKMNLTYHLDPKPISELYEPFKADLDENGEKRKDFIKHEVMELTSTMEHDEITEIAKSIRSSFISNIASDPNKPVGKGKIKLKDYISSFISGCADGVGLSKSETISDDDHRLISSGVDTLRSGVFADPSMLWGGTGTDVDAIPAIKDDFAFSVIVMAVCSGIGVNSIKSSFSYLRRNQDFNLGLWLHCIINNPYLLALIGVGLSTTEADVIYYSFSKKYGKGNNEDKCKETRKILQFLDTLNKRAQDSTFVEKSILASDSPFYSSRKALNTEHFPARSDVVEVLSLLLNTRLSLSNSDIQSLLNNHWYSEKLLYHLCDIGVVNIYENHMIALERDLEEEMLIYETFVMLGKMETGIQDSNIEPTITEFEQSRGFTLESLQKDAIKLCKRRAGVLSGCAGSGKTTTSDCMTEVLKKLAGYDIVYCAPTGKAARRLSEVVHAPVKTIHSQFGVSLEGSSYMKPVYRKKKKPGVNKRIYILDEMAMCSTSLMFELARNLDFDDIIYILGDVKQLPPIGKGCPFKTLMELVPCVELGVSKRAAEGSLVNYNTSLINFVSDGVMQELEYDDNTFVGREVDDPGLVNTTVKEFQKYMDGAYGGTKFSEDDIQVITGYQKDDIIFSVGHLNEPLQELLRGNSTPIFYHTKNGKVRKFYTNDRVIHTTVNSYEMCRYVDMGGGVLQATLTFGIANGDMGKLLGIVKPDDVNIFPAIPGDCKPGESTYSNVSEEEMKAIKERFEERADKLRDDSKINGDKFYFVVVKVYDTDLRRDVIVLYRATGSYSVEGLTLHGADLSNLELAYALTCHKMQGSQSPVVILPFGSQGSPHFINRNMINTMVTRSQGYVCCVGDIKGKDSLLNQGRKYKSKITSDDLLTVLIEN